ncbi:TetR/AcrR family transcriptional regulator [Salinicola avicenniae]|uniref:TetR/AcrR family transcriptional regulator n=1 Tax=Salinicola avicenniae TaxID=2916836 RepID=UPI0020736F2F|nr:MULTISPECIES: TetR/AcrR family transcriptional regulator [unclassified Salinicola]
MTGREGVRPGGRSARVQQAVHAAVRALQESGSREMLTIPRIAERAGVTPSTLYRRWGNLAELLADVSLERLRPDETLPDTGTLAGDLQAWGDHYLEEMLSVPGRLALNDIMASTDDARRERCRRYTESVLETLCWRARQRGEWTPEIPRLVDGVIAPMTYRLLYDRAAATPANLARWIAHSLGGPADRGRDPA